MSEKEIVSVLVEQVEKMKKLQDEIRRELPISEQAEKMVIISKEISELLKQIEKHG